MLIFNIIPTRTFQGMEIASILSGDKLTEYFMSNLLAINLSILYAQQPEIYTIPHFSII
jgi:hypothetical protein